MGGQKGLSVEGEKEELAKLLRTAAQQWLLRELDDGKGVGQGVELPASLFLSSLKVASNTAAGANWTCTAPRRLHFYLHSLGRGYCSQSPSDIGEHLAVLLMTQTEPLLPLDETDDGAALGAFPTLLCDVRFQPKSDRMVITTSSHGRSLLRKGHLPCVRCGLFPRGSKGLRMHCESNHGLDYISAKAHADACLSKATTIVNATAEEVALHQSPSSAVPPSMGTLILAAAKSGDLDVLRDIALQSSDLGHLDTTLREEIKEVRDEHGISALLWAAGCGNLEVCQWLVDDIGCDVLDAPPVRVHRGYDRRPLHWAARNGHTSVCRWLVVTKGVPVDTVTSDGTTALHLAASQGHVHACSFLNDHGASVDVLNDHGCSGIHWAASNGDLVMCRWLREQGTDCTVANANGHNPLHKAAWRGHHACLEWLLSAGGCGHSELRVTDRDGHTPASTARLRGFTDVADWLEDREREYAPK